MTRLAWGSISMMALASWACAPQGVPAVDEGDGGTMGTANDDAADPTTGGEATTDSMGGTADDAVDDTASDTTSDGEPLPPPPATGLQIVEVTMDQGDRIPIARNGELVGPAERNGPIFQERPGVLRAFFETDPGFETRTIYGVLTVSLGDGTEVTYESFVNASPPENCEGVPYLYDCRYSSPTGSFFWRLEPEHVTPDTRYRIELFETAPGHENDVSDKIPIFPIDGGTMVIGVEDSYMKMRVVIVPFYHDVGAACAEAPDLLEEFGTDFHGNPRTVADYFGERLFAHNPVDEVEIIVHDVVNYTGNATGGSGLLSRLQQMRFNEGAPPEYYYYGVIRPCGGGPDFSGIAQLGGPSPSEAGSRVGWGVYHQSISTTAETFVHEIGHEQGRQHVACNGEEGGPDASYPDHPEGDIESWGIDVMSNPIVINPPSSHDYMTYCGMTWVSEWGWHKVTPWIAEISSWELQDAAERPRPQALLVGTVFADGSASFYVTEGWWDPALAREGHGVQILGEGGLVADVPAQWTPWERTEDINVIAPLPVALSEVDALRWYAPARSGEIEGDALPVVGPSSFAP